MNKLLLGGNNLVNEGEYITNYNQDTKIVVENEVILHNYNKNNFSLEVTLKDNSKLNFLNYYEIKKDTQVIINIENNCVLDYYLVLLNKGQNKVKIIVNMLGEENYASIKIRAINENSNSRVDIICEGIVNKTTKNNILIEDLKGLIIGSDSIKISPNMDVYTNEVMANHLVTIGSFNKDELFYLQSKGLDLLMAKKIIVKSFMTANLSSYLQEKIKWEVINIE